MERGSNRRRAPDPWRRQATVIGRATDLVAHAMTLRRIVSIGALDRLD
jgi:hypothetical protein